MTTKVNGDTGVSQCQPNSVSQDDLQAGVVGKGPMFSAWQNVVQSGLALEAFVKMNFGGEVYDTNNNYDPATSRFTPTVAGYYLIMGGITINDLVAANAYILNIFKNGSNYLGSAPSNGSNGSYAGPKVSAIVYLNGSTDYVEIHGYSSNKTGWATISDQQSRSAFQAVLLRAA